MYECIHVCILHTHILYIYTSIYIYTVECLDYNMDTYMCAYICISIVNYIISYCIMI